MVEMKKYRAESLPKAMQKAKQDLGRDTVILHTRTYTRGGFMGFFGKQICEVTASSDINVLVRSSRQSLKQTESRDKRITRRLRSAYSSEGLDAVVSIEATASPNETVAAVGASVDAGLSATAVQVAPVVKVQKVQSLQDEMCSIKSMLHDLLKQTRSGAVSSFPEALKDVYLMLMERDVSAGIAESLVKRLNENLSGDAIRDPDMIRDKLRTYIADMIPTLGPVKQDSETCHTVAFIGPTGVGKTTTIAKLAAHLTLREGRSVTLITQDTYRLAAVEQLRTYAKLLNLDLHVVNTPAQMAETVRYHAAKDYILIDTAGRSQNNDMQMKELQLFMEAANPDETHLVLSATMHEKSLLNVKEKFSIFQPNRLILTKLDEAVELGLVLSVLSQLDTQLSYVTFGQEVPDDFEVGCSRKLTELILREATL